MDELLFHLIGDIYAENADIIYFLSKTDIIYQLRIC